ncbi:MAG: TIGR03790 family protein [Limisphaerales bacterium]
MAAAFHAQAGGSGLNVIVVANQNSSNSLQLANDYCERRGVPPQNLWRMTGWTGGPISWEESDFESYLLTPLLTTISSRALTNQAMIVLLSMDIPYRVIDGDSANSTTSALFYGFKTNTAAPPGLPDTCSLPDDSTNSYAFSELPFFLAEPQTASTNAFLAVMLTDTNLAQAETTLLRGAAGDSSFPPEPVYLEKTTDIVRNVRFLLFDNAIQESRARGNDAVARTNSDFTAFSDALGLDTGLVGFSLPGSAFVPGAIADSLTSFGGYIFENSGQTPLLAFLEAGASGSYGTVIEPCNYTYKFPDPMVYFFQNRGFCLAEAYYQSLSNPYQGLTAGEPLSAPFARPGAAQWNSPAEGSVLNGLASFNLSFSAADSNLPLAQVDLFVDGNFVATVTNLPPAPGNILSVTIGGVAVSYTVTNGDSLASVALGLASALMTQTNATAVQAEAVGDRLVLRSQNVAVLGSQISLQTKAAAGAAPALATFANQIMPAFLDSTAYGYHFVQTGTNVNAGDWLQLTFIKTNGAPVTVAATNAQAGASIASFLQALMNQINADPDLQTADGATASDLFDLGTNYGFLIYAASPGWQAAQIQTSFTGSTNLAPAPAGFHTLEDNLPDLQPRAHVYLSSGAASLPVRFTLNTAQYADGYHDLMAVAYEGTSVRTQTFAKRTVQFRNTTLSASLDAFAAGTNGDLSFAVVANATNIARIELFSTGGLVAAATNLSTVELLARTAILGAGQHPFSALVTDADGRQYQTATIWEQLPALQISLAGPAQTLSWTAISGRQYNISTTTNLASPFQPAGTVLATNGRAQWPIPAPQAGAAFYRVALAPY